MNKYHEPVTVLDILAWSSHVLLQPIVFIPIKEFIPQLGIACSLEWEFCKDGDHICQVHLLLQTLYLAPCTVFEWVHDEFSTGNVFFLHLWQYIYWISIHVQGSVMGIGNLAVNKTDKNFCFDRAYTSILVDNIADKWMDIYLYKQM